MRDLLGWVRQIVSLSGVFVDQQAVNRSMMQEPNGLGRSSMYHSPDES